MSAGRPMACGLLAILLASLFLLVPPAPVAAQEFTVGVSPATLAFDDPALLRGGSKVDTVRFQLQSDSARNATLDVVPFEPGAGETWGNATTWVATDLIGDFMMEPGEDRFVEVTVSVPETAANGLHKAGVRLVVHADDTSSEGAGAGLAQSVTAEIAVEVGGEQVKKVEAEGSPEVRDAEEGGDWGFTVPLHNSGNVEAAPQVRVEIWDKFQTSTRPWGASRSGTSSRKSFWRSIGSTIRSCSRVNAGR